MSRRSGLGRGLAALIPPAPAASDPEIAAPDQPSTARASDEPVAEVAAPHDRSGEAREAVDPRAGGAAATVLEVSPERIDPNPRQPREVFDDEELEGLAVSLRDLGLLQPLVVRPGAGDRFELIAGERRLRAAKLAGLERIPVLVRHTDDADLLKEAVVENIHRVQLNPLEEAAAYQQLLEEFGFTQEELAARLGRSRPAVSNALRLLTLPPAVQRRVAAGVLSAGHAKALLTIDDPTVLTRLADRVVAEGLSVRATEELVRVRVLGQEPDQPSRRRTPRAVTAPGLVELQDDLSDALMARVRITMGARKGRMTVEFASIDDLERIVGVIAEGLGADGGVVGPGDAERSADGPARDG
jgi:ParB family transcriptional regulator, chromosome partitioning protein